jgi:hypothetical protein
VTSPQKINFVALYTSTLAIGRSGVKSRAHTSHHPKGPSSHLRINNLLWLCILWKPISFLSMKTKHTNHRRSNTQMNLVTNHQLHEHNSSAKVHILTRLRFRSPLAHSAEPNKMNAWTVSRAGLYISAGTSPSARSTNVLVALAWPP